MCGLCPLIVRKGSALPLARCGLGYAQGRSPHRLELDGGAEPPAAHQRAKPGTATTRVDGG